MVSRRARLLGGLGREGKQSADGKFRGRSSRVAALVPNLVPVVEDKPKGEEVDEEDDDKEAVVGDGEQGEIVTGAPPKAVRPLHHHIVRQATRLDRNVE